MSQICGSLKDTDYIMELWRSCSEILFYLFYSIPVMYSRSHKSCPEYFPKSLAQYQYKFKKKFKFPSPVQIQ